MKNWTNHVRPLCRYCMALGAATAMLISSSDAIATNLRQVVMNGQPAPGLPAGYVFSSSLNNFRLNAAGEVGLTAFAARTNSASRLGVWVERDGQIAPVAVETYPAPGAGEIESAFINQFNGRGDVTVRGRLLNAAFDADDGYWLYSSSGPSVIFRENMTVPVFGGSARGYTLLEIKTNEQGESAVWATYNRAGAYSTGLWLHRAGTLSNLISANLPAPGIAGSATFASADVFDLNDMGHVAAKASLTGSGVDASNNSGIWTNRSGALQLLVRAGDPAPGLGAGVVFANLSRPYINNDGTVAFLADTRTPSLTSIGTGIWIDRQGVIEPLAVSGDLVAGVSSQGRFNRFQAPSLNQQGRSAFFASMFGSGISSSNDTGLWSDGFGERTLVAREGSAAVGAGNAVFDRFFQYGMNNFGQVSFLASVRGVGIDGSNDLGLWVQDRAGVLHLVAREGDQMSLPTGGAANIIQLNAAIVDTDAGPNLRTLNDAGLVAFSVRLDNGTERLFVTDIAALPEPSAGTLLLSCVCAEAIRRRRKL